MSTIKNNAEEIPRAVARRFVESDLPTGLEPMAYVTPMLKVELSANSAQSEINLQRNRFKTLITTLLPMDEITEYLRIRLEHHSFPFLTQRDFAEQFARVLRNYDARKVSPKIPSFDLQADRRHLPNSGFFDVLEWQFVRQLVKYRPAIALSVVMLRKYFVEYTFFLREEIKDQLPAEWQQPFVFFCQSWYQNSYVHSLYPSIAMHMQPLIDLNDQVQFAEAVVTPQLFSETMAWMNLQGLFRTTTNRIPGGFGIDISCAAAGLLTESIGKRQSLHAVYGQIVDRQDDPMMHRALLEISSRGMW